MMSGRKQPPRRSSAAAGITAFRRRCSLSNQGAPSLARPGGPLLGRLPKNGPRWSAPTSRSMEGWRTTFVPLFTELATRRPLPIGTRQGQPLQTVTIAGKYCESGDVLIDNASLPELDAGDLLAVPMAGAYCLAMASNYNLSPRPAVVIVADGSARLIRRRETYDDLLRSDVFDSAGESLRSMSRRLSAKKGSL